MKVDYLGQYPWAREGSNSVVEVLPGIQDPLGFCSSTTKKQGVVGGRGLFRVHSSLPLTLA